MNTRNLIRTSRTGRGDFVLHVLGLSLCFVGPTHYGDAHCALPWTRLLRVDVVRLSRQDSPHRSWAVVDLMVLGWGLRWSSSGEPHWVNLYGWWPSPRARRVHRERCRAA